MKTLRFAFLLVLFVGCASTPRKMAGKYGVVLAPRMGYNDQIVHALRERLSTVDVVASPADDAYDAVIVLDGTTRTPNSYNYQRVISKEQPMQWEPDYGRVQAGFAVMRYEIHRRGTITAKGSMLASLPGLDITDSARTDGFRVMNNGSAYGTAFDFANQIVRLLEKGRG